MHLSLSDCCLINPFSSSPPSDTEHSGVSRKQKLQDQKSVEAGIFVLQAVKKNYAKDLDCCKYCFANRSLKYDHTASSYIAKIVEKLKSQMKEHFFDPKDLISTIGLLVINLCEIRTVSMKAQNCGYYHTKSASLWLTHSFIECVQQTGLLPLPPCYEKMILDSVNSCVHIRKSRVTYLRSSQQTRPSQNSTQQLYVI